MTSTTINRRSLLTGTIIAATIAGPALAQTPRPERIRPSPELRALVKAHKAAYAALLKTVDRSDGSRRDYEKADRIEQQALLAVCSYPALEESDRRAKAKYLLMIEGAASSTCPSTYRPSCAR